MAAVCGVPMLVGTISHWAQATPAAAARTSGPEQAVAHLDEPSGRQGDKHAW